MKHLMRRKLESMTYYFEIALSAVVLVGMIILAVELVKDIYVIGSNFDILMAINFEKFMGDALKLVIGIEFVRMLLKRTPESMVEVLIYAVARKLITGISTEIETIIGIVSIVALFAVRRYLFDEKINRPFCEDPPEDSITD